MIGSFVLCSVPQCDGLPGHRCAKCASRDLYDFAGPFVPPGSLACKRCGAVRFAGY